jgi:hypothetical protein
MGSLKPIHWKKFEKFLSVVVSKEKEETIAYIGRKG